MSELFNRNDYADAPSGIDCHYFDMGNAGLKVYVDCVKRDEQFRFQRFFHENGLAPDCWFKFDFTDSNGRQYYAFFTEKAECRPRGIYPDSEEGWEWGRKARRLSETIKQELGVTWTDNHGGNVGILRDKLVIIDCDPFFMSGLQYA